MEKKKFLNKNPLIQDCIMKFLRKEVMEFGCRLEFSCCVRAAKEFPT